MSSTILQDSSPSAASPSSTNSPSPDSPEKTFWKDFGASFVVVLVALPLALGIALASGAPSLMAGLIACVVGGLVVGFLGGAPLQVSGPAAGLTVIVYGFVQEFGWAITCAITCCSGFVQLLLGYLKIARICLAISSAVVHGMLAGIGVVIVLSQSHIILGGGPQSSAILNILELPAQLADLHGPATGIGLLTLVLLVIWSYAPAPLQKIPRALVAVSLATALSISLQLDIPRVHLPEDILSSISLPELPGANILAPFLIAVLTLAVVASVESLLCAVATDKMHTGKKANLDQELIGQGAGNLVSGFLGGLPITGVIVRSSANISAGAQTQWSGILHGLWILFFVVFCAFMLEWIPLSALAALLVYVGVNLVNPRHIRELRSERQLFVYGLTLFAVVFWSLLGGVLLGVAASVFLLVLRLARTEITISTEKEKCRVTIEGTLTFLSIPELSKALADVPAGVHVEIDLLADLVDRAALEALHSWRTAYEQGGGKVDIDESHELPQSPPEQKAWNPTVIHYISDYRVPKLRLIARNTQKNLAVNFFLGVQRFHKRTAQKQRRKFFELSQLGQHPKILFAGCADSRVVPHLITATQPGEMFTIQNIGNILSTDSRSAELAALEYAMEVLCVEHIMVCGHSDCGAMKILSGAEPPPSSLSMQNWMENAKPTVELVKDLQDGFGPLHVDKKLPLHDQIAQANVVRQLQLLSKHPLVQQRLQEEKLNLWGLYFDIPSACLYFYDKERGEFANTESFFTNTERSPIREFAKENRTWLKREGKTKETGEKAASVTTKL